MRRRDGEREVDRLWRVYMHDSDTDTGSDGTKYWRGVVQMWELGGIGIGEQGAYAGLRRSSKRNTPTAAAQPAGISTNGRVGTAGRAALASDKEYRPVGKASHSNFQGNFKVQKDGSTKRSRD
jgi:hypothetical protein